MKQLQIYEYILSNLHIESAFPKIHKCFIKPQISYLNVYVNEFQSVVNKACTFTIGN